MRWLRRSWQEAFLAHRPPAHPRAVSPSQTTLPLPAQPSGGGRPRRPHSSPSLCQGGWLPRVPGTRISDCKAPQRTVPVWGSGPGRGMLSRVHGVAVGSPQMSLGEHSCLGQPGLGLQERGCWLPHVWAPVGQTQRPHGELLEDTWEHPGAAEPASAVSVCGRLPRVTGRLAVLAGLGLHLHGGQSPWAPTALTAGPGRGANQPFCRLDRSD